MRLIRPKRAWTYAAAIVLLLGVACAPAGADRVRFESGSVSGEVIDVSPLVVFLERDDEVQEIPVERIRSILFEDEPAELSQARLNAASGGYATAIDKLDELRPASLKTDLIEADADFYRAYCSARLAIAGAGDAKDAGRLLTAFVREYPKSFHYFHAVEALGDLWLSLEKPKNAKRMYGLIAAAESGPIAAQGHALLGEMHASLGDHESALQAFREALAADGVPEEVKRRATFGAGVSLAALGRVDEGLARVRAVISGAQEGDEETLAAAYNTLGRCLSAAGRSREALFAHLHVDMLYSAETRAHAEALYWLAPLWEEAGKGDEARAARATLARRYAQTVWAKRALDTGAADNVQ